MKSPNRCYQHVRYDLGQIKYCEKPKKHTNSMNVLIDLAGQVEVDNVSDIWDVETTGGNGRRDQNRRLTTLKSRFLTRREFHL